ERKKREQSFPSTIYPLLPSLSTFLLPKFHSFFSQISVVDIEKPSEESLL
ncbi:hypothetical protein MRB53_031235, partial [Persea americana]